MRIENCHLFKRSFTNKGIGFTFNSDIGQNLYKISNNNYALRKTLMVNEEDKI